MKAQRQLMELLPPKQQTLDFGMPSIWQRLPDVQQKHCQAAIAELIYQVAQVTQEGARLSEQGNNDHE